jgi:hypothetical protein
MVKRQARGTLGPWSSLAGLASYTCLYSYPGALYPLTSGMPRTKQVNDVQIG